MGSATIIHYRLDSSSTSLRYDSLVTAVIPEQSVAMRIALLSDEERERMLDGLDLGYLTHDWTFWSRPNQRFPDPEEQIFRLGLLVSGRGYGKTRSGTEWAHKKALSMPGSRGLLVARTAADTRDVLVEGDSGLLNVGQPADRCHYEPSKRRVTWPNKSTATLFTAEEPDVLRGPQGHWAVCVDADTMVDTPSGPAPINTIRVGDRVRGSIGYTVVTASWPTGVRSVVEVQVRPGRRLVCTPDHYVATVRGWVRAGKLTLGDLVRVAHLAPVRLTASALTDGVGPSVVSGIRELPGRRLVWDITTESADFYANDILVHNCDEVATWRPTPDSTGLTAWDNVNIATRLPYYSHGTRVPAQLLALTTPKRTPLMKDLLKKAETDDKIILRRGRTSDNAGNLDEQYLDVIYGLYGGTRLAIQELEGEMLSDVEGALWTMAGINADRVETLPYRPLVYVVAVDPSVAEEPTDECGIVVCAATTENDLFRRSFYVVEDATILGSPNIWASQVVRKANEYQCPIVAEINQGGALVRNALQNIDPTIKVLDVRARYGKQTRAEPISLAFEQHRGHMVGWWSDLEDQLTTWLPSDRKSPDRLDAMVWGGTALLIKPPPGLYMAPIRAHSNAHLRIPSRPPPSRTPARVIGVRRERQVPWRTVTPE